MSQLLFPTMAGQASPARTVAPPVVDQAVVNRGDVFRSTKHRHSRDRAAVAELLQRLGCGGATRHEIASALHMPLTTVCGRVNELKKLGEVTEPGERRPTPAGKTAVVVVWIV